MLGVPADIRSLPYFLHGWGENILWCLKPAYKQFKIRYSEIHKLDPHTYHSMLVTVLSPDLLGAIKWNYINTNF